MPHVRQTIWKKATQSIPDFVRECAVKGASKDQMPWYGIAVGAEEKEFKLLPADALKELTEARDKLPETDVRRMRQRQADISLESEFRPEEQEDKKDTKAAGGEGDDVANKPSELQRFAWSVYNHLKKHDVREGRWILSVPHDRVADFVETLVEAQEDGSLPCTAIDFRPVSEKRFLVGVYTSDFGDTAAMQSSQSAIIKVFQRFSLKEEMTYKLVGVAQLENEWDVSMKFMLRERVRSKEIRPALDWNWFKYAIAHAAELRRKKFESQTAHRRKNAEKPEATASSA